MLVCFIVILHHNVEYCYALIVFMPLDLIIINHFEMDMTAIQCITNCNILVLPLSLESNIITLTEEVRFSPMSVGLLLTEVE